MELITDITARIKQIPLTIWLIGAGLIVGLIAIFVFQYPVRSLGTLAFYGLFIGGHFLMHRGHSNHAAHNEGAKEPGSSANQTWETADHSEHSGGCH